jgi:4-diphosphocytidyl-2-C-methyl-D-erythritol kinase
MLLNAARVLAPAIEYVAAALESDARALQIGLSGSGATMFALTAGAAEAKALAASLSQDHPGWWVTQARLAQP